MGNRRENRVYNAQFKQEALRLVSELGSARAAARKLCISPATVCRWTLNYEVPAPAANQPESPQVTDLKKENQELKDLINVLKESLRFYQQHEKGDDSIIFQ